MKTIPENQTRSGSPSGAASCSPSSTPETHAAKWEISSGKIQRKNGVLLGGGWVVEADVAEGLERQRDAMKMALNMLTDSCVVGEWDHESCPAKRVETIVRPSWHAVEAAKSALSTENDLAVAVGRERHAAEAENLPPS